MFRTVNLQNGVNVLLAKYEGIETVSFGISYNVGGRNEWKLPHEYDGVSHFLEHLFFKGNGIYTSDEVNEILDDLGGINNAFTTEDVTCYYAHIPAEVVDDAIELFHNLLNFRKIDPREFEKESFVVRQEMKRMEDTPHFHLFLKLKERLNKGTSLEMTVIGNEFSLTHIGLAEMEEYRDRHYDLSNAVILVVGNFEEEKIISKLNSSFGSLTTHVDKPYYERTTYRPSTRSVVSTFFMEKQLPMIYFGLGMKIPGARSKYVEGIEILSVLLSSGRSCMLQDELVRPGIASFAWAEVDLWEDIGNLIVVVGTETGRAVEAIDTTFRTLYKLATTEIDEALLQKLCSRIEYKLRSSLENPRSYLFQQSTSYWRLGRFETIDEQLEKYRSVTPELIREIQTVVFGKVEFEMGVVGSEDISSVDFPEDAW